ncbi:MAG: trehalose-phosphatase [Coxiellaceae bacterium]|nr:trehalose-phosphatase [Coxiellaceae bacterium]
MFFYHELLSKIADYDSLAIFLDYDGTIVNFSDDPHQVYIPKNHYAILKSLVANPHRELVIVTGRDRDYISRALFDLPVTIFAEHGACVSYSRDSEWKALINSDNQWSSICYALLENIVEKYEGVWIEKKPHSLCLHYRKSDFKAKDAHQLVQQLNQDPRLKQLTFIDAYLHIDCRLKSVSKFNAVQHFFRSHQFHCSLAIGDDITDIDMFDAVKGYGGYSIAVGDRIQSSDYHLRSVSDVMNFLQYLDNKIGS